MNDDSDVPYEKPHRDAAIAVTVSFVVASFLLGLVIGLYLSSPEKSLDTSDPNVIHCRCYSDELPS